MAWIIVDIGFGHELGLAKRIFAFSPVAATTLLISIGPGMVASGASCEDAKPRRAAE
jgi:hypothetical protein